MSHKLARLFVPILAFTGCLLQGQGIESKKQSIFEAIRLNWEGWETGNRSTVEANLAEEYFDTDFSGVRRSKLQVLEFFSQPSNRDTKIEIRTRDHQILFLSKGAVTVSYQAQDCRTTGSNKRCFDFSNTDTLVQRKGRWLITASHQSMIPAVANKERARLEVLATQAALDQAQIVSDTDTFRSLTTDGHLSKEKFIQDMRDFWKPTRITRFEQSVQIVGETATVKGEVAYEWTNRAGVAKTAREDITDVFVRQFGVWRRAASDGKCLKGSC